MSKEIKAKKRYHIFFFFIRTNPEQDNSWSKLTKRKSQITLACILLLVLGIYFYSHAQLVASPMYKNLICDWKSLNKSVPSKTEVRHIGFLKVHKAGSSTIQNILFRHGEKRQLMFIIPAKGAKFSEYNEEPNVILDPLNGTRHDILAIHSTFNREAYSKYLWNDSKYVAIIRDPLELMISGAYYHRDRWKVKYLQEVPNENYILNLIRHPEKYDKTEYSLTRNSIAMDFGLPNGLQPRDTDLIEKHLKCLDDSFDLVLILEHLTESLVLMRRTLNWPLSSILYITLNDHKHPTSSQLNISERDRQTFKERNFLDVAIYEYFYNAFMTRISKEGEDFYEEVRYFQSVLNKVQLYCLVTYKSSSDFVVEASDWNERFTVSPDDCDKMRTPELKYLDKLRDDRIQKLYKSIL